MLSKVNIKNQKILIYGLGISGRSCLNFLYKNNDVNIFDDNKNLKNNKNKKIFLNINQILDNKFDHIVISPGIDIKKCKLKNYLLKNKEKIITEIDIFCLNFPGNTKITITGTNGKSTVCKMLFNIFKSNKLDVRLVGNIGNPPLLEKKINKKTIFVIEASSYQIFYSKYFKTDHAAILNLNADHLERHGNLNKYADAKLKLIYNQEKNKQSYIEKNNRILTKNIKNRKIKSKINKVTYNKKDFFKKKIKNLYLLDENNLNNIHFVYLICKKFKLSDYKIFRSLNIFKGLKYRKEIIYNKKKLKIINDSKSTSFSSTVGLLSSYKNIYWIVGGLNKKGDKFILPKKYYKNIFAYIIGLNKNYFVNQFQNRIKFKFVRTLKQAILAIKKDIKYDALSKTILFSPAAASFDQFSNFEERGKLFNKLIANNLLKNDK